jgi:hypothetical protein
MKRTLSAAAQSAGARIGAEIPWRFFKNMGTCRRCFDGKFAKIHDHYRALNPFAADTDRYLHYNVCFFANLCRQVPGDFVCAGVSFGATARVVYEFVDFPTLGKTFHLIDSFEGTVAREDQQTITASRIRSQSQSAILKVRIAFSTNRRELL